jgi:hypothetical protein
MAEKFSTSKKNLIYAAGKKNPVYNYLANKMLDLIFIIGY